MDVGEKLLEMKKREVGANRIKKYRTTINSLRRFCAGKLDETLADMKKTEKLVEKINASHLQAQTKRDFRLFLKMLWKLKHGFELEDRPKEIRWIKTTLLRSEKKLPTGLISENELKALLKAASIRNRAIISLLYEAGLRNSELCALKKSDIEFIKEGARITIPSGKTGSRAVLVIDSVPALATWISQHPIKDGNANLFVGYWGRKLISLKPPSVEKAIRETAELAGIRRRIYPHLFRHTAATKLANHLTEAAMKAYFGWEQSSKMAAVYIHLSGKDTDEGILRMHNKPIEKKDESQTEPKICKRCNKTNMHDAEMCAYCGLGFDHEKAKSDMITMKQEIAELKEEMKTLMRKKMKT